MHSLKPMSQIDLTSPHKKAAKEEVELKKLKLKQVQELKSVLQRELDSLNTSLVINEIEKHETISKV